MHQKRVNAVSRFFDFGSPSVRAAGDND